MKTLSTENAAKMLQVSSDTVLRLIHSKKLSASRLTGRSRWRIRRQDLEKFAKQHGVELLEQE